MKLHLGCGHKKLPPPWLNCDGLMGEGVDRVCNMLDLCTFDSQSVEWIYSSHAIEHVEFDSLPKMFASMHRVLIPGGKITLATIDINGIYHNRYLAGVRAASWISALYGDSWGLGRPMVSHCCAFDEPLLTGLLEQAGFANVRPWEPEQYPEIQALGDCATTDRDVSLLLEATA